MAQILMSFHYSSGALNKMTVLKYHEKSLPTRKLISKVNIHFSLMHAHALRYNN